MQKVPGKTVWLIASHLIGKKKVSIQGKNMFLEGWNCWKLGEVSDRPLEIIEQIVYKQKSDCTTSSMEKIGVESYSRLQ